MPPLNSFIDSEVSARDFSENELKGINIGRDLSTSSFDRQLNDLDPAWKFAFPPTKESFKSVSFNDHVRVENLPNRHDWSEEEKKSRWISDNEYTSFKLDVSNTVFLLRNEPESINDTSQSSRGVECRDPLATLRRRNARKEARNIVFEEQKIRRQRVDEQDDYLFASMYSLLTQNATRQALDFAAQDELDAKKFQSDMYEPHYVDNYFFNQDWISSIPTSRENSSLGSTNLSFDENDDKFGFCILGDIHGFDNSWLRGDI